jgi:hypothetical protein
VRSHVCAIGLGSQIAYMCDRMFVRLEVQACMSVARFLVKSHGRATIVMGCMMFHVLLLKRIEYVSLGIIIPHRSHQGRWDFTNTHPQEFNTISNLFPTRKSDGRGLSISYSFFLSQKGQGCKGLQRRPFDCID